MSTVTSEAHTDDYVLGRTPAEYERLRAQARVWEAATGRLLDRVELGPGARCLDAGCGPGRDDAPVGPARWADRPRHGHRRRRTRSVPRR